MDDEGLSLRLIVVALAAYLRANPAACDTADGIRRWWFRTENEVAMDELAIALAWMQGRGLMEPLPAADARVRFRRSASDAQLDALIAAGGSSLPDTDGL